MIPFYQRSIAERLQMTEAAIREKRTLMERWTALEAHEASGWTSRAALAADYLKDQCAIADFGCGTMNLAAHLRPDQIYIPVDVVARDARTLVCDLNLQPPPQTEATAAAVLGVLEYLHDPLSVLTHMSRQYRVLVVSYAIPASWETARKRRANAWVNDFSEAEMRALFEQAGWRVEAERSAGAQKLWRLASVSLNEAAAPGSFAGD